MKNFILTPIKPVKSQFEKNYEIILTYVRENFDGLVIGAKRKEKCFSNQISFAENDNIIIIKRESFPPISVSKHYILYNLQKVTSEKILHDVCGELIILKDFAENPGESKYSYTIEKPRKEEREDIFFLED